MKIGTRPTAWIVFAIALAGCSGEKHPSNAELEAKLSQIAPQMIEIGSVQAQFSPMSQFLGTTLPTGSMQAVCKVNAKLKQGLYTEAAGPDIDTDQGKRLAGLNARAKGIDYARVQKMCDGLNPDEVKVLQAACEKLTDFPRQVVIALKTPAGQAVAFNATILAIPQVDSWKLEPLGTDWGEVKRSLGEERQSFRGIFGGSEPLVAGSPEALSYEQHLAELIDNYESLEKRLSEKYSAALAANSQRLLDLVKSGATLEGDVQTGFFTTGKGDPIKGVFSPTNDASGDGILAITNAKNPTQKLVCRVRVWTPETLRKDQSVSVPAAAAKTLALSPQTLPADGVSPGSGLYELKDFDGYLGFDGNKLAGEIRPKGFWVSADRIEFALP
jgi:hypothetical protein